MNKTVQMRKDWDKRFKTLQENADNMSVEDYRKEFNELKEIKDKISLMEESRDMKLPETKDIEAPTEAKQTNVSTDVRSMSEDQLDKAYEKT